MGQKIIFTKQQINELHSLIDQHMCQTDIATHFNVTDDTIRRVCREEGIEIKMPYKCKCVICGDEFYSNIKGAKTCKKEHHRICKVCGKDFIVDRSDIRNTCKGECTNIAKYGVASTNSLQSTKDKKVATNLERYGVENISQSPEYRERMKQTWLEKYGVDNPNKCPEIHAKIQQTNLKKYGCKEPLGDSNVRALIDAINMERYGTIYPMQTKEIRTKQNATMQERYGVDNCMQLEWVQKKLEESLMNKYGVPHAVFINNNENMPIISGINRNFAARLDELHIEYQFEKRIHNRSYDLFIPSLATVIEINPTITHNSHMTIFKQGRVLPSSYHKQKTLLAKENGFRCINIFDWDNWEIILQLIKPKERIYARNCKLQKVDQLTANQFTANNHLQGSCNGQIENYGLYYEGELIEIMTFGQPRYNKNYQWELLRLCTISDKEVVGGASKLFKAFTSNHVNESIISYCDLSKFSGSVYEKIGMKLHHISEPAKIWSKDDRYITDNLLRQRGYDQLFGTSYGKGTSNEELMLASNWLPVYDCGQAAYVFQSSQHS